MIKKNLIIILLFFTISNGISSGESLNKILAIVGKHSISQLDFEKGEEIYRKVGKPGKKTKASHKTQVLDFLISRKIIEITADEESIQVDAKRIETHIEKVMEAMGIHDRPSFEKFIVEKTSQPFEFWLAEVPTQIRKDQLMHIRVPPRHPTDAEMRDWYNTNKNKVGYEIRYREIAINLRSNSSEEERKVLSDMQAIKKEIKKDSGSFNQIAGSTRNQSILRGNKGLVEWTPLVEIYNKSRIATDALMRLEPGGVSDIFVDERRRYVMVKLEGKRETPYESIKFNIQNLLAREKTESAFDDWIAERRKEVHILIYDKEYIAENKLEAPDESFNYTKMENQ